jgi:hypothetical protein
LRAWLERDANAPVVALRWDRRATAFRLSSAEDPYLRSLMAVLLETDSRTSLDRAILSLLERLPPVR